MRFEVVAPVLHRIQDGQQEPRETRRCIAGIESIPRGLDAGSIGRREPHGLLFGRVVGVVVTPQRGLAWMRWAMTSGGKYRFHSSTEKKNWCASTSSSGRL